PRMMSARVARTSAGRIAFTVAAVPTGMKAGARIAPRCIWIIPVRAAPSVAEIEKANLSVMPRAYAAHRQMSSHGDRSPRSGRRPDGDGKARGHVTPAATDLRPHSCRSGNPPRLHV